jgi:hypothetical protein
VRERRGIPVAVTRLPSGTTSTNSSTIGSKPGWGSRSSNRSWRSWVRSGGHPVSFKSLISSCSTPLF